MKTNNRLRVLLDLLLLFVLFWIVRYWHSIHFGLYEDDLTIIPDAFGRTFNSLMGFVFTYITQFMGHARPLSNSFIYLFSWIGWQGFKLWGPYLIGYLITILNIGLFYWLMYRVINRPFALLAGLAYILYSADTTQAFLTHSLGIQPSITFILLASNCYLSNKRVLAYVLAFLVLFSYETPFLLFLAIPLLKKNWNKTLLKEIVWHAVILILMLGVIFVFRASIGEGRVADLGLMDMITTPILHMLEGSLVSLGTFLYRPYQTIQLNSLEVTIVVVISFFVFLWIISKIPIVTQVRISELLQTIKNPIARRALPDEVKSLGRNFVAGVVMLVAAYPLTFTVRAYAISGRDTRVHTAGVMGAALLVATFIFLIIIITNGSKWRMLVNVFISLDFALLMGFGFVIQRDYVSAWQYERNFWTDLLPLIQDAKNNTYILVTSDSLKDTQQIEANTWALPNILGQMYEFPTSEVPRVFRLRTGWQNYLDPSAAIFLSSFTSYVDPNFYEKADFPYIILIDTSSGKMVRRTDPLMIDGQAFSIMQPGSPTLSNYSKKLLYQLMIYHP